jgi:hypothetical protein
VLRQRLEKVQLIIGKLEEKTLELIVKSKVTGNEKDLSENDEASASPDVTLDQSLVDQLMAQLR